MIWKVLLAMLLAVLAGWATGSHATLFGVPYVALYNLIGQLFLNALSLVVVPLIAASIITGTAKMGGEHSIGSIGLKTLGAFVLTSTLAILVGLAAALIVAPGISATPIAPGTLELTDIHSQMQGGLFFKIEQILVKIIPGNIFSAASSGQTLGIIGFCMLFGYFMTKINPEASATLLNFWQGVFEVMMKITHLVLLALPIGVFGLVAKAIATTGLESLGTVAWFFGTVIGALAFYVLIVLSLLLKAGAGVNPLAHLKAMVPALITAFSTSSSAATLPVTLECVEKRAGVPNRIASFALPLGTSINLSGSSLYVCVGVLFIAQAYGLHLPWPSLALIVVMTLITSLGSAGIPSASLISIVVILQALGLPGDAIGLIMTVERLLDMFRTPVNVYGTSCCAVLVASSEGELQRA